MSAWLGARRGLAAAGLLAASAGIVWACSGPSDASGPTDAPPSARVLRQGSFVAADSLANTRIGGPFETALAYRFRASRTGSISGVRFYVIANSQGRTGYSGGTGGRMRVALARDSGGDRHVPAGTLASATLRTPNQKAWPHVRFRRPARVVAGRLYHVVFTNVDRNPRQNYVSVNALLSRESGRLRRAAPADMAVLLGGGPGGAERPTRWRPRAEDGERYLPILDIEGSSGRHSGIGYMEVWVNNPKPIGAGMAVRQTFRAPAGRRITAAWLRVRRVSGSGAPLQLRIEREGAGTVAAADVPADAVPSRWHGWVRARFSRPVSVPPGAEMALAAASPGGVAYEAFPIRQGTKYGFDERTVFDDGYAQFTDGDGWEGWDQWNVRDRRDGDLQFSLETEAG